ncbi:MAG: nitrate/nitrite transporter NrtS [Chthoniobacterales bacterium]|nr:nitrate/nitrite transporter NrtS [Chthoniobacterales bacterium]
MPQVENNTSQAANARDHHATGGSRVRAWLVLAAHPATFRRAIITALVVGATLIAINHGAAIVTGTVTRGRVLQMCLTVIVPFLVSTTASVATRQELERLRRAPGSADEGMRARSTPANN